MANDTGDYHSVFSQFRQDGAIEDQTSTCGCLTDHRKLKQSDELLAVLHFKKLVYEFS